MTSSSVLLSRSSFAPALAQHPAAYSACGQSVQAQQANDGTCRPRAEQDSDGGPAAVANAPAVRHGLMGASVGAIIGTGNRHYSGRGVTVGATAGAVAGGERSRRERVAQARAAQSTKQSL